jgi:AhpD family alkylhydroperoxidase
MSNKVEEFKAYRKRMNERLLDNKNLSLKRFFHLDSSAFQEGELPWKTKEMLGLVASMVLRCDDCIRYHVLRCYEAGLTKEELLEIFSIGMLVGGSICIPHSRRALEFWEELENEGNTEQTTNL